MTINDYRAHVVIQQRYNKVGVDGRALIYTFAPPTWHHSTVLPPASKNYALDIDSYFIVCFCTYIFARSIRSS